MRVDELQKGMLLKLRGDFVGFANTSVSSGLLFAVLIPKAAGRITCWGEPLITSDTSVVYLGKEFTSSKRKRKNIPKTSMKRTILVGGEVLIVRGHEFKYFSPLSEGVKTYNVC